MTQATQISEKWDQENHFDINNALHHPRKPPTKPKNKSFWGIVVDNLVGEQKNQEQNPDNDDVVLSSSCGAAYNPNKSWPRQNPPIHNPLEIPAHLDWDPYDTDIDEDDIDAHIDRCLDRIHTGIIPAFWQLRLEKYQKRRSERDAAEKASAYLKKTRENEPKGLGEQVYQRVYELRFLEFDLTKKHDPQKQLPNVRAVLKAYRSGRLNLVEGNVIFYIDGEPLGGPQEWNVEKFLTVRKERPEAALWVEGIRQTFGAQESD